MHTRFGRYIKEGISKVIQRIINKPFGYGGFKMLSYKLTNFRALLEIV